MQHAHPAADHPRPRTVGTHRAPPSRGTHRLRRLLSLLVMIPALAVLGAQAIPAASATTELCPGTHLTPPKGDEQSFAYTAPDGFLVASWCVKAGTTTEIHAVSPPSKTVTIEHSSGKEVSHFSVVLVPAPDEKPLTIDVTASGTLARDYAWSIDKVADATTRTVDASGNATFTYTVTARAGAATESGWTLGGTVTVANPNGHAITADVTAATDLGGGAVCLVTGGNDAVVPAGASTVLTYTCTFGSHPALSGTVTASAAWDAEDAGESPVTDSTPVTLAVSETNKTVQVVDDKTVPGQRIVLDPALVWSAGLVRSYTYSLTVPGGAAGQCRTHTNTATIDKPVGEDPTDSVTVQACTPPVVPPPPPPPTTPTPPAPEEPEVLPTQDFGKATGKVRTSCQGTVTARMRNATGGRVTYVLRVGKKAHRITVGSGRSRVFQTKGRARARVVLKVGPQRLAMTRIPARCLPPEVLPDTGLRIATNARLASIAQRWS